MGKKKKEQKNKDPLFPELGRNCSAKKRTALF